MKKSESKKISEPNLINLNANVKHLYKCVR